MCALFDLPDVQKFRFSMKFDAVHVCRLIIGLFTIVNTGKSIIYGLHESGLSRMSCCDLKS